MKLNILASSVDPTEVSLTVKGILTSLIPLILVAAKSLGAPLTDTDLAEIITVITSLIAGVIMIVGLLRKLKNSAL